MELLETMSPENSCKKIIGVQNNEKRSTLLKALKDSFSLPKEGNPNQLITAFDISLNYNMTAELLHRFGICLTRKEILNYLQSFGYSPSSINIGMSTRTSNYYNLFNKRPLKSTHGAFVYTFAEIIVLLNQSYTKLDKLISESFSSFNFTNESGLYILTNQIILRDVNEELYNYFLLNPESIFEISPRKYEELVADIFKNSGYDVELTPSTGDGGYDIIAIQNNKLTGCKKYLIECKRYKRERKVGIGVVRNLYGIVNLESATKGIITTTSSYTKGAKELAKNNQYKINLLDYNNLRDWVKSMSM